MSAYDDFCGCGDYCCRECFGGDNTSNLGNAWMDRAMVEQYPNSAVAKACNDRLTQHGMNRDEPSGFPLQETGA